MKGISMAIETIIYIILAVTVLTVLLLFFTKTGGDSQTQVELQAKRNIYCSTYTSADPMCARQGTYANGKEIFSGTEKTKFSDVCVKLKAAGCPGDKCFASCCALFCPKK
jgi:hypothetical protein